VEQKDVPHIEVPLLDKVHDTPDPKPPVEPFVNKSGAWTLDSTEKLTDFAFSGLPKTPANPDAWGEHEGDDARAVAQGLAIRKLPNGDLFKESSEVR
jgi:hypothetical protein